MIKAILIILSSKKLKKSYFRTSNFYHIAAHNFDGKESWKL